MWCNSIIKRKKNQNIKLNYIGFKYPWILMRWFLIQDGFAPCCTSQGQIAKINAMFFFFSNFNVFYFLPILAM